jgi:predicted RNA methylase
MTDTKQHWEKVFSTKLPEEVSWTQAVPLTSLSLIHETGISKSAPIIDIGGGDSKLVDNLLAEGYTDITVLDISGEALKRAKARLGNDAANVKWIESDIKNFIPSRVYAVWHDRAAFHFLTEESDIKRYAETVGKFASSNLIIATFSESGPEKCSALPVSRYNEQGMQALFSKHFSLTKSFTENHTTPFNTTQNFRFNLFARKLA